MDLLARLRLHLYGITPEKGDMAPEGLTIHRDHPDELMEATMRHPVRLILTALLGSLLALPLLGPAPAAALSCGPCPATATADLNLRAGPSLSAEVLRVIPAGAGLERDNFTDPVDGFVPVTYDGTEGWAFGAYLLLFPSFATTTADLNLREDPSLGAEVLAVMPSGTQVEVLGGPENGFFSVRYEQRTTGWASANYLDLEERTGPPPPSSGGEFEIGDLVVTTTALNYRTEPSLDAAVVKVLSTGTQGGILDGPVSADGYTWYQLGLPGYGPDGATPGWVAGEFLTPAEDGSIPEPGDTVVTTAALNFRTGPGLDATIANVLPVGTRFEVVGGPATADGYTWIEIRNQGYGTGWVAAEFLSEV